MAASSSSSAALPLKHVVIWKIRRDAPPDAVEDWLARVRAMTTLPGVIELTVGTNLTPSQVYAGYPDRSQGFTHMLVMTLSDAAGLKAYQEHPTHIEVRDKYCKPLLDPVGPSVIALDYPVAITDCASEAESNALLVSRFLTSWKRAFDAKDMDALVDHLAPEGSLDFHSPVVHTIYTKRADIDHILKNVIIVIEKLTYTHVYTTPLATGASSINPLPATLAAKGWNAAVDAKVGQVGVIMVFEGEVTDPDTNKKLAIQGLDIVILNRAGKIVKFTVMLRPMQAYLALAKQMRVRVKGASNKDKSASYVATPLPSKL